MKKIYLDSDYKCHLEQEDTFMAIETDYFDGKCDNYIKGHRFVPKGKTWIRSDGIKFSGETISPWINYDILDAAQQEYERTIKNFLQAYNIPVEDEKIVQNNYSINSFIFHLGQLYKVIYAIPCGALIILNQNVILTTMEDFLKSLEEK